MPSSPSSYLPSGSAGPSSGHDRAPSQAGTEGSASQTSRRGKRKKKEQMQDHTHTTVPSSFYLPYRELVHRAALALKTCEPLFSIYKIPKECEPSVLAPPNLPALQPFAPALELARHKFGFYQEDKRLQYVKDLQAQTQEGLTVFEKLRSCYPMALGYDDPQQDARRQQHYERGSYNSRPRRSRGH